MYPYKELGKDVSKDSEIFTLDFIGLFKFVFINLLKFLIRKLKHFNFKSKLLNLHFKYQLKNGMDLNKDKIKFIFSNGTIESIKRPKIELQDNLLTLQQEFQRKGFYDVHLYFDHQLIATYTFKVIK